MLFLISCRARAIDTAKTSHDPTLDDETVEDAAIEAPAFRGISVEPDVFDVLSRARNWMGILRITGAQCWRSSQMCVAFSSEVCAGIFTESKE